MSAATAVSPEYVTLLSKTLPRVIQSDEQNERYIAMLYDLEFGQETLSADAKEMADLLALLIEDYEEKHYGLKKSSPVETIEFLLEQHNLKQKDLADVFGTASVVSEVLNGKRELNKQHIRKLSERFNVSPELFF